MIDELIKERLKKLQNLKKLGIDPYPPRIKRTHAIGAVVENFETLAKQSKNVSVAGRVMGLRNQGGVIFADLKDETSQIQLVIKQDNLKQYEIFRDNLDIGDFLEATGTLFTTKKGEKSIEVKDQRLIVKSLRPL